MDAAREHFESTACRKKLMIKNGDDVRQDQLILQLIRVMDHCLKRVGLDLKLTVSCLRQKRQK